MRGVITAPKKIITGAFTLLFSFPMDIDLSADHIHVETIDGDALGHPKDNFCGSGKHYHLLCYIPDARAGKSRVSVVKDGVDVSSVVLEYDTVRTVNAAFGEPVSRGRKVEIPVSLDTPVRRLKKRHFLVSPPMPCTLYGSGNSYDLVVSPSASQREFSVSVSGNIEKANGLDAVIAEDSLEVTV